SPQPGNRSPGPETTRTLPRSFSRRPPPPTSTATAGAISPWARLERRGARPAAGAAGAVNIFYGLANGGLPSTASQTLVQDNPEAGDRFGAALTAGSFNNDSITDLVVGVPGEDVGTRADAG